MGDKLLEQLAEHLGVPGVILALCLWALWKVYKDGKKAQEGYEKQLKEIHEKRVADAQSMVEKLLSLNDKWNQTLQSQLQSSSDGAKVLEEVRDQLDEVQSKVDDLYEEARR